MTNIWLDRFGKTAFSTSIVHAKCFSLIQTTKVSLSSDHDCLQYGTHNPFFLSPSQSHMHELKGFRLERERLHGISEGSLHEFLLASFKLSQWNQFGLWGLTIFISPFLLFFHYVLNHSFWSKFQVEKEPNGDMKHPIEGFIPILEDLYKTSKTRKSLKTDYLCF